MWWIHALPSIWPTALVVILAKIGIMGVDSNLAIAIRTVVILVLVWGIMYFRGGAGLN